MEDKLIDILQTFSSDENYNELNAVDDIFRLFNVSQQSELLGCEHNVITVTDRDEGKCDACGIKMIRTWQSNCG